MQWYLNVLKNYAKFDGRAHREEYWMFFLFNFLVGFGTGFVDGLLGSAPLFSGLYNLAVFLPGLGVTVRRLHDTNRSGWWVFVTLIPIIGIFVLLYLLASAGDDEPNDYGGLPPENPI